MNTNSGIGVEDKWVIKIKKEIRVYSCSFVAEIYISLHQEAC